METESYLDTHIETENIIKGVPMDKKTMAIIISITFVIATACTLFICYIVITALFGDAKARNNDGDRILLLSVFLPDAVFTLGVFTLIIPATFANKWTYSEYATNWLGYLHLVCVLHPALAIANVANIIAFTYTEHQHHRLEDMARTQNILTLVLSYFVLTLCFCCFPSLEKGGFSYHVYYFTPLITVYEGFGGIISLVSHTGLALIMSGKALRELNVVKNEYLAVKPNKKVMKELDTHINYIGLNMIITLMTPLVLSSPVEHLYLSLVVRAILYTGPVWRVLLTAKSCPYFKLIVEADDNEMVEFAQLGVVTHHHHHHKSTKQL